MSRRWPALLGAGLLTPPAWAEPRSGVLYFGFCAEDASQQERADEMSADLQALLDRLDARGSHRQLGLPPVELGPPLGAEIYSGIRLTEMTRPCPEELAARRCPESTEGGFERMCAREADVARALVGYYGADGALTIYLMDATSDVDPEPPSLSADDSAEDVFRALAGQVEAEVEAEAAARAEAAREALATPAEPPAPGPNDEELPEEGVEDHEVLARIRPPAADLGEIGRAEFNAGYRFLWGAVAPSYEGALRYNPGTDDLLGEQARYGLATGFASEFALSASFGLWEEVSVQLTGGVHLGPGRAVLTSDDAPDGDTSSLVPVPPRPVVAAGARILLEGEVGWVLGISPELVWLGVRPPTDALGGEHTDAGGGGALGARTRLDLRSQREGVATDGGAVFRTELTVGLWTDPLIWSTAPAEVDRWRGYVGAGLSLRDGVQHEAVASKLDPELAWRQDMRRAWLSTARVGAGPVAGSDRPSAVPLQVWGDVRTGRYRTGFVGAGLSTRLDEVTPTPWAMVGTDALGQGALPTALWLGLEPGPTALTGLDVPLGRALQDRLRFHLALRVGVGLSADAPWQAGFGVTSGYRHRYRERKENQQPRPGEGP